MGKQIPSELLDKYLNGECTPAERALVEYTLDQHAGDNPEVYTENELRDAIASSWPVIEKAVYSKSRFRRMLPYTAAAAAVALFVAFVYLFSEKQTLPPQTVQYIQDVAPGGNHAVLTLPNGKQINLSQANKGNIPNQFSTIEKRDDGEVVFTPSNAAASSEMSSITTPRGGQFIVQLPDGSKVWLNAASSLKFPVDFKGFKNRLVELTGEAYFEVAKNTSQPFIVETPTQRVQVLGTHFNINAYPEEQVVKTTLLEGAVRLFSTQLNTVSETLKPGQMAYHQDNKIEVLPKEENAIAWTEGKMKFSNVALPPLMREVSRWYNVTIKYEGPISTERFTASISRDSNLSELLHILEGMGIHFSIEQQPAGNVLIVKN
ncbi:DUF4974 domain-containing protein [Chitinophaga sp. SYP-B3965]|uniref:FecR family protein n=1 Tax=Chitinophaga sp. SYP-B3965 TaxID=2663120 RepID=UPI0012997BA5|nr:FecR family protein [Chitinophaga sp. SYP-B3965]MRG44857.1 DUF4974 domain-containing protein [Chitinophaga sp. SYP-B3965]